jgi:hypothetical protein
MRVIVQGKYNNKLKNGTKYAGSWKFAFNAAFDSLGGFVDEITKLFRNINSFFF